MLVRHTPPAPLKRGDLDATFLFENEDFIAWWFPLLRGDKGECYGEVRDLAQRVFRGEVPRL